MIGREFLILADSLFLGPMKQPGAQPLAALIIPHFMLRGPC
jgi:hypothetical protein